MTVFTGFSSETFAFLGDLRHNNKRSWFEANRDRYEAHWKAPALAFIEAIASSMRALDPPLKAAAVLDGSLRRISRDVRFSSDKAPYDPHIHMIFWAGEHPTTSAGFQLVLNPDGIGYGAGHWSMDAAALQRYRDRVCNPVCREPFLSALKEAEMIGCFMDEPQLKHPPVGYAGEPEWDYLLRYTELVSRTMEGQLMPDWINTPKAVDEVLARVRHMSPLIGWLNDI